MGSQMTKPAVEIYQAVLNNDLDRLQELVSSLKQYLSWTDMNGMNPLLIAATKNHYACLLSLLEHGVDVHFHNRNPCPKYSGSALHAATRHGHERIARLLLSRGCNPFICNTAGNNCLHEAMRVGSTNLLRLYEMQAPWHGQLLVKTSSLVGLFKSWKVSHMVVCPLLPAPDSYRPGPIERELWIYDDHHALAPKLRVNLANASVERPSPTEAILRFHPKDKLKTDICIKKDQQGACCLQLRSKPDTTRTLDALIAALGEIIPVPADAAAPQGGVAAAAVAAVADTDAASVSDDSLCVICLAAPKEAGYLHVDSVHKCVCRQCVYNITQGKPCPVCRQKVERIVDVF